MNRRRLYFWLLAIALGLTLTGCAHYYGYGYYPYDYGYYGYGYPYYGYGYSGYPYYGYYGHHREFGLGHEFGEHHGFGGEHHEFGGEHHGEGSFGGHAGGNFGGHAGGGEHGERR